MNLSSYLQMPPAPNVPKSTATGPASGAAAGARVDAGNSLGLDFAQIMSRQLERLPQMQRQDLAAAEPHMQPAAEDSAHQTQKRSDDRQDDRAARDDASHKNTPARASTDKQTDRDTAHTQRRHAASDDTDATLTAEPRTHKARQSPKARSAQDQLNEALLQALSSAPNAVASPIDEAASASTDSKPSLQTIALSPQIQIITDPKQAPSNESLAAFAKSMGLDEAAIQALIANDNNNTGARTGLANANALSAATLQTHPGVAPQGTAALMAGLQSHGAAQNLPLADANTLAGLTTAAQAVTPSASGSASLLAPDTTGLPGALLPPMSAADLATIEHIQITIMPALASNGTTGATLAMPSTQDVLSLLTGDLQAQDIGLLSAQFNAGDQQAPADQHSGQHNPDGTPFAQVMGQQSASTSNTASAHAPATSATPMSEVYDQLSDKLATEMAARLHKQLSDGEWKMKFGLRPAHLGGVEIQLEMKDGKLDAVFRADNPLTRDLLQNSSQRLREALENFGIHAGQVHVGQQGGNAQQNASRHSANQPQVGDNSPLQVKGDDTVVATAVASNKANASLLDLYA